MASNSYVAVGNVEDLSNIITNICPSETPLLSAMGKSKAIGVVHSWMEDDLRAPGINARMEGSEFTVANASPRKMAFNVTQILSAGYQVSGTQEKVAKHGVKSELGYQMQKCSKELALDHEYAILNNTAAQMGGTYGGTIGTTAHTFSQAGAATTANATALEVDGTRRFRGLANFIETNEVAAGGALTEEMFNEAIQLAWAQGGSPKRAFMSANVKKDTSAFFQADPSRTVNQDQSEKKFTRVIRFYESDFGVIEMIPHRLMADDTVLIIDSQYTKMADLRPIHRETIPRTHDAINGLLLGETTLEVRAEKAHAKITGVVPSKVVTGPFDPFRQNVATPINTMSAPVGVTAFGASAAAPAAAPKTNGTKTA
jgi:hypothetical protein